jgi:hypothetical protein
MKKTLFISSLLVTALLILQSCEKESNQSSKQTSTISSEDQLAADTAIIDTALLCYLPFNGNLKDKSKHGNNGTVQGGGSLSFVADRFGNPGKAVLFGGSNSWIEIPEAQFVGLKTGTIALDFYPTSSAPQVLASKMSYNESIGSENFYQSFILKIDEFNVQPIQFGIRKEGYCNAVNEGWNSTLISDSGFVLNQWNHVAVTFNNNVQKMYLNGNLVGIDTKTASPICQGEPIRLGVWWQADPLYFTGTMDEVRLYKRVLSATEIRKLSQK